MTRRPQTPWQPRSFAPLSGLLLLGAWLANSQAQVQTAIRPDGTLGTAVTQTGSLYEITGGTRPGNGPNLFHSFDRFRIGTGDTARFTGPTGIANILSRVTGGEQSIIDGRLQSAIPGANFYLLNPSGVLFGPNASLDVSGSFHVSTADYLRLEDGGIFSANLSEKSTLTVAPPEAFGFLRENPAGIAIQGSTLAVPESQTLSAIGGDITVRGGSLIAPGGRLSIASVASPGTVTFSPSLNLEGFGRLGKIELSDFAVVDASGDGGGTVVVRGGRLLAVNQSGIAADTLGNVNGAEVGIDVAITEEVFLQVGFLTTFTRGPGAAGNIRLVTDSLRMTGDLASGLFANIASRSLRSDAGRPGDIKIKAGNILLQDNLSIQTFTSGPSATGNITIEAESLQVLGVKGDVFISTSTFGAGSSGNLDIYAKNVLLQGGSEGFAGLATQVSRSALESPSAGNIRLITDSLQVLDGAQINTALFTGAGRGGDIEVHSDTIRIAGLHPLSQVPSCLCADVRGGRTTGKGGNIHVTANDLQVTDGGEINAFSDSLGDSGNINVQTKNLLVSNGAFLTSTNFGAGRAGDIDVRADHVRLVGPSPDNGFTGIFATGGLSARNAGNIRIKTGSLEILDGAQISNRTSGPGKGGNIEITAERMLIAGTDPRSASLEGIEAGIFATTILFQDFVAQATGKAGHVLLQAEQLDLRDQGKISALSTSAGDGGNIDVLANRLTLTGGASITAASTRMGNAGSIHLTATDTFQNDNSRVTTAANQAQGGDLTIAAARLQLTHGAVISAESTGPGNAGSIHLMATDTFHSLGSTVTTEATQADGGNITVQARQLIRLRDSQMTATVGGGPGTVGGNITIDPEFLVLENSQIRANAFAGRGGNIQLAAGVFLADPASQVSASSTLGINGAVEIRAPIADLSGTVAPLPQQFAQTVTLLHDRCAARLQEGTVSSLVERGRDGVPANPDGVLPGRLYKARAGSNEPRKTGRQARGTTAPSQPGLTRDADGHLQIKDWPILAGAPLAWEQKCAGR